MRKKNNMAKEFYKASNDSVFKAIFCNKSNKDLLEKLIEVSIKKKVKVNDPLMQEVLKPSVFIKNKTLDVLTESTDKKSKYNIELNVGHYDGLNNRNAGYIFSKYSEDVKVSENYNNMRNFIQINLTSGLGIDYELVNTYKLIDPKTGNYFIKNLTIYEFYLDKIKDTCYTKGEKEYKILAALCCDKEELHELCKGDKVLEKLEREVIKLNKDPEFIEFLSAEEDAKKVHNTLMNNAKEEGLAEGIEQNKITIAKNMLKDNIPIDTIIKYTTLTKDEIESLK